MKDIKTFISEAKKKETPKKEYPMKKKETYGDLGEKWFDKCKGACVLRDVPFKKEEVQKRFGQYHFFLRHLVSQKKFANKVYHLGWRMMLSIQKHLGIKRDASFIRGKASQWCSLNEEAVKLLLLNENLSLKRFRRSWQKAPLT